MNMSKPDRKGRAISRQTGMNKYIGTLLPSPHAILSLPGSRPYIVRLVLLSIYP